MIVVFLLIPLSIVIGAGFLVGFIWAVRSGQFEDTYTPSMRILLDDVRRPPSGPQANTPPQSAPENSNRILSNNTKTINDERTSN